MDKGKLSTGANLLRLSTVGFNFAFCIFVGLGMGWGAKKLFHLGDWAVLAGILLGIVSAYVLLFEAVKELRPPSGGPPRVMMREPLPPLAVLVLRTSLLTLAGGMVFAGLAYLQGQRSLALGFVLGALLSPLNLFTLRSLSAKVLSSGQARAASVFWTRHLFRWIMFTAVGVVLVRISTLCLLGALGSYTWFLGVLAWQGWDQGRQLNK